MLWIWLELHRSQQKLQKSHTIYATITLYWYTFTSECYVFDGSYACLSKNCEKVVSFCCYFWQLYLRMLWIWRELRTSQQKLWKSCIILFWSLSSLSLCSTVFIFLLSPNLSTITHFKRSSFCPIIFQLWRHRDLTKHYKHISLCVLQGKDY